MAYTRLQLIDAYCEAKSFEGTAEEKQDFCRAEVTRFNAEIRERKDSMGTGKDKFIKIAILHLSDGEKEAAGALTI